mmetsp:Transcript_62489/g.152130  ORF Transcript_62489/g.152130 Transcript_62489/m.152130 type:complete len:818 (-) Transcript_62489:28-2481(-)
MTSVLTTATIATAMHDTDNNNNNHSASSIVVQQNEVVEVEPLSVEKKLKENEGKNDVLVLGGGGESYSSFGTESIGSFGSSGGSSSRIFDANNNNNNNSASDAVKVTDATDLNIEAGPTVNNISVVDPASVGEEESQPLNGRFGGGSSRFLQRTSSLSSRFSSFRNRASSALSSSIHSLSSKSSSSHSMSSSSSQHSTTSTGTSTTAGKVDGSVLDFDNNENLVKTLDDLLISATTRCYKTSFVILQPFKDDDGIDNNEDEDEGDFQQSASSFFSEDKDDAPEDGTNGIDCDDCERIKSAVSPSSAAVKDRPTRNSSRTTTTTSLSSLSIQTMWRRDVGIDIKYDEGQKDFQVVHINVSNIKDEGESKDNDENENNDHQKTSNDYCSDAVATNSSSTTEDDDENHSKNNDNVENDSDDDVDDVDLSSSSGICWPIDITQEVMNVPGSITVLESIDGFNCQQRCPTIDALWVLLDRSLREKTKTTITFATKMMILSEASGGGATAVTTGTEIDDDTGGDNDDVNEMPADNASHLVRDTETSGSSIQERGIDLEPELGDKANRDSAEESIEDSTTKDPPPMTVRLPKHSVHQAVLIVHNPQVDTGRFNDEDELQMKTHGDEDEEYDVLNDTKYLELPGQYISALSLPITERRRTVKSRKIQPKPNDTAEPHVVVVGKIPRQKHWLSDSCIQAGDTLLSINDIRTYGDFDSECTGPAFYKTVVTKPYVRIRAYGPTIRRRDRMDSFRRAAVGVAGGTLVGVGGVLMVTPLHPIGHAMAIGGVGVLGSEFEGPRKAMRNMKNGLKSGLGNSLHSLSGSVHK